MPAGEVVPTMAAGDSEIVTVSVDIPFVLVPLDEPK